MAKTDDNTKDFWLEVGQNFGSDQSDTPTYVLSPRQTRWHQLAMLKVPKFQHLSDRTNTSHTFCFINKSLFENFLHEWYASGLLDLNTLENEYKKLLPPEFMRPVPAGKILKIELGKLIKKRDLSPRFAQLWGAHIRRNHLMAFINILDPYQAANKSAKENDSSVVDRYIYAVWMHSKNYIGEKGTKDGLITKLALLLDNATNSDNAKTNRPWHFSYYESLLNVKSDKNLIIRTVTDMTPEQIEEYATDGAFTTNDFPELFSVT